MNLETVNTFPFDPRESPFSIEVSGTSRCTDFYVVRRPNSHCYIFEYVVKGQGTLVCNGTTYHPKQGDVYILHKGSDHQYCPDPQDPWEKIWFNVDGILVPNLLASYSLTETVFIKQFQNEAIFRDFFEWTSGDYPHTVIMEKASVKFHILLQHIYSFINQKLTKNSVGIIKSMLDASLYNEDFSLQDIADELCLSKAQIIKIFRQGLHQTPYQYFINQRIRLAASMLLNTQMSINEISEILHFADQRYFSTAFKRVIGITPSKYRNDRQSEYGMLSNLNYKKDYAVKLKEH
jgi:AraC-like DNA-binding protein